MPHNMKPVAGDSQLSTQPPDEGGASGVLGIGRHQLIRDSHMFNPNRPMIDLAGVPSGIGDREELIDHSIPVYDKVCAYSMGDCAILKGLECAFHGRSIRDMKDD